MRNNGFKEYEPTVQIVAHYKGYDIFDYFDDAAADIKEYVVASMDGLIITSELYSIESAIAEIERLRGVK